MRKEFMRFGSATCLGLEKMVSSLVGRVDEMLNGIKSSDPSVKNTVNVLAEIDRQTDAVSSHLSLCKNLSVSKEIREAAVEQSKKVSQTLIDMMMDKGLFAKVKLVAESGEASLIKDPVLRQRTLRVVDHLLRDLKRSGLDRSDEEIDEIKAIKKKISDNSIQFHANINADETKFVLKRSQLVGMPGEWFTTERLVDKSDDENSTYVVTMKYPDLIPVLDSCSVRETREMIFKANCARCREQNTPLLEETIVLKDQLAQKLGYPNYADFKTEDKVVKSSQNATRFLARINRMFEEGYDKDLAELTRFAKENGFDGEKLEMWDTGYYSKMYREKKFNYDREELKKKFPIEKVVSGMLKIYQKILKLKFVKVDTKDLFHETEEAYDVYDETDGTLMGRFYTDLYPRDGKYTHACVSPITLPHIDPRTGEKTLPSGMLICNFGAGHLYLHEVVTLFHEFGHMMHLLSVKPETNRFSMFSSFGCEWDFVETPSQMFEFWCYEKEPLMMMSEGLTDEDIQKIRAMKHVLPALHYKRQLLFGVFDMSLHSRNYDSVEDVKSTKLWLETQSQVLKVSDPTSVRASTFGHIMGGYDAGYYGYLRSETFAADLFYRLFKDPGLVMDPERGEWFRKNFLGQGSTMDANDLMRSVLGSDPDESSFVRSLNE